jgi:two-component system, NarL family, nitrate/nitrite response regulator NarL
LSEAGTKLGAAPAARAHQDPAAVRRRVELLLADDHPLLLRGLRQLFDDDERFRVIATASDGERLLDAIERFAVDVVVMGWLMPYLDGEAVLKRLREHPRAPRVVVYSGLEDPHLPRRVMALGGAAFCSKRVAPEELRDVVAAVAAGRIVFPYEAAQSTDDPLQALTEREGEILAALAGAHGMAPLAHRLGISPNTLKFHLRNIYQKLGVANRAQAVALHLSSRPPR